jgi:enamine deaminase RidA (YjgF/YER057c/UK114 family)
LKQIKLKYFRITNLTTLATQHPTNRKGRLVMAAPSNPSASTLQFLQPPGWPQPKGYANGIAATGRQIFVGGTIGWNEQQEFTSDELAEQTHQALKNIVAVLAEADAGPEHVVRMTWYVTDKREYLAQAKAVGAAYRDVMGYHFPAMALVQVVALVEDRAKVEIETTAVIPVE